MEILSKNFQQNFTSNKKRDSIAISVINSFKPHKLRAINFRICDNKEPFILPSNYFYTFLSVLINTKINNKLLISQDYFAIHHFEMNYMKDNYLKRIISKIIFNYKYFRNLKLSNYLYV